MRQNWVHLPLSDVILEKGRELVKIEGRKIAVFQTEAGLLACDNSCPHEGYPLIEGTLGDDCRLTCNWHSWTFDLRNGKALMGRDPVRTYAIRKDDGGIWVDLTDPPKESRIAHALDGLKGALDSNDYTWIARSLARLAEAGGNPLDAVRQTLEWSEGRFEYGFNHAHAVMADWLLLAFEQENPEAELACYLDAIGYFAEAGQGGRHYAYSSQSIPFHEGDFLAALEKQDENKAIAMLNGTLADGFRFLELEEVLAKAALGHYHSFGHSLIYLCKIKSLIDILGPDIEPFLLRDYVRGLANASREDLIPEFRAYGTALASWNGSGVMRFNAEDFSGQSIRKCLDMTVEGSGTIDELFEALLGAAALNMLRFNTDAMERTDLPISRNVGWLDFTHAITFGSAVRTVCRKYPDLWPRGLLQLACFVGRNVAFLRKDHDFEKWIVPDAPEFFESQISGLIDHGEPAYIYAAHRVKTLLAVRKDLDSVQDKTAALLLAGLHRYLSSPIKQKHMLRTATQALDFIRGT